MGPSAPRPFRFACASEWHRCAEIRVSPGGWGRNMFLSEAFRGLRPRTPAYFSLAGKVGKRAHGRRNPFDGVSPPCPPLPRRHKGGARRHKLRIPHPAASGRLRSLRCASFFLGKRSAGLPRSGPFGAVYLRRTPGESPNETCPPLAGRQAKFR